MYMFSPKAAQKTNVFLQKAPIYFTKGPDIFYKRPRYILQATPIYFTNDPDIFYPDAPDLSPGLVPASPFWTTQHTRRGINLPLVLRRSINTSVHMLTKKTKQNRAPNSTAFIVQCFYQSSDCRRNAFEAAAQTSKRVQHLIKPDRK